MEHEHEHELAVAAARQGENVYPRHVRVADLPRLPDTSTGQEPKVGQRRVEYGDDGETTANLVYGGDGQ